MDMETKRDRIKEILKRNDVKILENYLYDNNISLKDINSDTFDVLDYSIKLNSSVEVIKYIINKCQYKPYNYYSTENNNSNKIPLFSAISLNNFKVADLLLDNRANFKKFYRNREPLTDKQLRQILSKEKNKILVNESMYKKASDKDNVEAIKIIFDHDGSDQDIIFCRINKYDLLEKAVKSNNYTFVRNILGYKAFAFKNIFSERILVEANRNGNMDIMKLLIIASLKCLNRETIKGIKKETSHENDNANEVTDSTATLTSVPQSYDPRYLNVIINIAIKLKNIKLVEYLVEDEEFKSSVNLNEKDMNGEYPIIISIYSGNTEIFEYLLNHGADCNTKDSNGNPLLFLAINNNPLLVRYLLKKPNININEKDANGNYPLINAISQNDLDNVILLVKYAKDYGVDMNIYDMNGNTPLTLSYKQGHFEIFRFLVKYLDIINEKDASGNSIIYYSINEGDVATTKYLISNGIDVNFKDKFGNSTLHISIYKKNREIISALLQNKNIILNTINKRGESPLITIIKINDYSCKDNEDIIKELIKRGSSVNFVDNAGNSPLVYAIQKRTLPIVKLLIKKGANVNFIIKKRSQSILMYAIELGEIELVKHLVKSGADIDYINEKGISILRKASEIGDREIFEFLIKYNANNCFTGDICENEIVYSIISKNRLDLLKILIANNLDINIRDNDGDTAITYAIRNRMIDILKYLVSCGASIHNINNNGQNTFFNGDLIKLQEYIKKYDLKLKDLNNTKYDVLISAINCDATLDIIKYIISQVQYKNFNYSVNDENYGRSDFRIVNVPLFTAISNNNFEISNFLITKKANINFDNSRIIFNLLKRGKLNVKNLGYILNKGFDIKKINSELIHNFLEYGNAKLLNYLFRRYIFNNQFIINLLSIYEKRKALTNVALYSILNKEKNRFFTIEERMYEKIINSSPSSLDIKCMDILFKYDCSNPANLFYRIKKFKLLTFAIKKNRRFLIKEIIKLSNYDNLNNILNQSFSDFNDKTDVEAMKFVISNLLETIFKLKQEKFLKCIRKNLLEVSTNFCGTSLMSFLINWIIKFKNLSLVKYIIENEEYRDLIDINTKDINGEYPIFVSLYGNDDIIFKYLIEKGANYNIKDNSGNSVISLALATNSTISNYLLEIPNIKIKHSKKLLFNAIGMGDSNLKNVSLLVKYRLSHHLSRRIKNVNGDTPLTFSYKLNHREIFKFLVNYFYVNDRDNEGFSPLYYAIKENDDEMTKYLIDMGANVKYTDYQGNTYLHTAIENHQRKIIFILLDNSYINVNKANNLGYTPLIILIKSKYSNFETPQDIIYRMIERGSNINDTDNLGNSALFYIIEENMTSLIELFIKKGAKVNIKNTNGYDLSKNDSGFKPSLIRYVRGNYDLENFLKGYEFKEIKQEKKKNIHYISTDDNSNNENNNNENNNNENNNNEDNNNENNNNNDDKKNKKMRILK
ncbi:ankyrin repeat-containing domain protein [Neocallimastix sp. 'constans']